MYRHLLAALLAAATTACATYTATSGRVVLKDGKRVVDIAFNDRDREVIERYYRHTRPRRTGLPPGLAKRAGNLPPGLAKRDTLPPGLRTEPLPYELEAKLSPLPSAYVRVRIGRDIVLMNRKTHVIFDVIHGVVN